MDVLALLDATLRPLLAAILAAADDAKRAHDHQTRVPMFDHVARSTLDLIADRLPVWQPVEPGTVIKAGTHYRIEWDGDDPSSAGWAFATERRSSFDFTPCPTDPGRYSIDPRTVPAEPEDPRIAVVAKAMSDALDDNGVTTCDWTAEARFILAKLDRLDR